MIKEVISGIEGVGVYQVFSFVVFFLFFIAITGWVLRSKKKDFEEVSKVPLADSADYDHSEN